MKKRSYILILAMGIIILIGKAQAISCGQGYHESNEGGQSVCCPTGFDFDGSNCAARLKFNSFGGILSSRTDHGIGGSVSAYELVDTSDYTYWPLETTSSRRVSTGQRLYLGFDTDRLPNDAIIDKAALVITRYNEKTNPRSARIKVFGSTWGPVLDDTAEDWESIGEEIAKPNFLKHTKDKTTRQYAPRGTHIDVDTKHVNLLQKSYFAVQDAGTKVYAYLPSESDHSPKLYISAHVAPNGNSAGQLTSGDMVAPVYAAANYAIPVTISISAVRNEVRSRLGQYFSNPSAFERTEVQDMLVFYLENANLPTVTLNGNGPRSNRPLTQIFYGTPQ
ncbi:MAG: hypothetical protein KJ922_05315 [Nanoarchaeota archaeon]|nr:hypothetical protein [Nanoarchaeota archaeon]